MEERRVLDRFKRNVLRDSSVEGSSDDMESDKIVEPGSTTFITGESVQLDVTDSLAVAPRAWSTSFAQARRDAIRQRAMEERFSWMTEADQSTLTMGLEPVPWNQFSDVVARKGKMQFQAIEQRMSGEQSEEGMSPMAPEPMIVAAVVVKSETTISAFRKDSGPEMASFASAMLLCAMVEALPKGARGSEGVCGHCYAALGFRRGMETVDCRPAGFHQLRQTTPRGATPATIKCTKAVVIRGASSQGWAGVARNRFTAFPRSPRSRQCSSLSERNLATFSFRTSARRTISSAGRQFGLRGAADARPPYAGRSLNKYIINVYAGRPRRVPQMGA
jgi:hypothetical protein